MRGHDEQVALVAFGRGHDGLSDQIRLHGHGFLGEFGAVGGNQDASLHGVLVGGSKHQTEPFGGAGFDIDQALRQFLGVPLVV